MIIKTPFLGKLLSSVVLVTALSACSSSDDNNDVLDLDGDDVVSDTDVDVDVDTDADADADADAGAVTLIATCDAANAAETPSAEDAPGFAFASTRAADFSSGRLERLALSEQPELSGCTPAGASSDVRVATDGQDAYEIGRFNLDFLTRFESETLETIYQYSVFADDAVSANPHDVVFLNETKAYIARYGTTNVWIVNPSAATEEEFFLGTLDLAAYDADGATEMTRVEIVGDRLFVLMQRLQNFSAALTSVVAVFDVNSDTEIATGMNEEGLNGIALPVNNASDMFFNEATNDLIVNATGDSFNFAIPPADRLSGGLVAVDATDFTVEVLIDDNAVNTGDTSAADFLPSFFNGTVIASADKGYISTFTIDEETFGQAFTLHSFNPTTGVVSETPVAGFDGVDVSTMAVGPNGNVWLGIFDLAEPGFDRLNPADDTVVGQRIRTELVPSSVIFLER